MKKTAMALSLFTIALVLSAFAAPGVGSEQPVATPTSIDLYGASEGFLLRPGDVVTARTAAGVVCGSCVVTNSGFYGLLHVYGDDPTTPAPEGALPGERLRLEVNGEQVRPVDADPSWTKDGDRQRVNIAR
jgi:hypothetical protein